MNGVPRKALLFITFRLLALENATDFCGTAAREMARETLDLFVPIANRLSLGNLRRRLEDACFHILDPEGYADLREKVTPIQAEDNKCLQILLAGIRRLLDNSNIQGRVQGRTKSLHGIRRKMARTGKILEEIMDRVVLRVIVASVPECYTLLGLLHAHFKPIPGTFDDYIGLPKDNGYQSLHTCVYPVREISHKPIEFQVRTELMHMEAEHGTAAHWRYKNEAAAAERDRQRAQWMKGLVLRHREAASSEAFVELLHRQVFRDHLVVFGNGGRIVRLAEKATVRDYLKITNFYAPKETVVKVNGKVVALDCSLRDGDSIEVPADGQPTGFRFDETTAQNALLGIGAVSPFDMAPRDRELPDKAMIRDQ
jgi:GTP pyrophosphokinase